MIKDKIWIEKYRPKSFDELIFKDKEKLLSYLKNPSKIPSFIFYSIHPGTGKTSTAKIIEKTLDLDMIKINASDDRGIDNIREIKSFVTSMSSNPGTKKCVFLDEADGLTWQAQDAMKVLMEEYSNNSFFILSCNDISKISDPIKSRCVLFNFDNIDKFEISPRLNSINENEKIGLTQDEISDIVNQYIPDVRKMINVMQEVKLTNDKTAISFNDEFKEVLQRINKKDIDYIFSKVFGSKDFDMLGFVRYFFIRLYNTKNMDLRKRGEIGLLLADIVKSWAIKANTEIVFVANINKIMTIL